jgi:hypothetical protein
VTVTYWIVATLLALFYLYAGGLKLVRSRTQLEPMMAWVDTAPMPGVRALGGLEILGAAGLILPPLTGVTTLLAIAAATGLLTLQTLAAAFHLSRGETTDLWLNAVLAGLAAVAVWAATAL